MCQDCSWDGTISIHSRLGDKIKNGTHYKGRPIIHRDSPIDGGVYLGANAREAIVVDSSKDPDVRELYKNVRRKSRNMFGFFRGKFVLPAVFDAVAESMPDQDEDAVNEVLRKYDVGKDTKIYLGVFLREGAGLCRHDALACGVALELLKKNGYINGNVSVDRNELYGRHAWTRYTDKSGIHVIDVGLNYLGPLQGPDAKWHYARPEDLRLK
ncbi:MAG: hypothetical protein AABX14_05170 [Candidatus Aenigmatarchaeota archaeon]